MGKKHEDEYQQREEDAEEYAGENRQEDANDGQERETEYVHKKKSGRSLINSNRAAPSPSEEDLYRTNRCM